MPKAIPIAMTSVWCATSRDAYEVLRLEHARNRPDTYIIFPLNQPTAPTGSTPCSPRARHLPTPRAPPAPSPTPTSLKQDVTQSIRVPKANRPGEVFASNPSVSRVLQRWVALDGVLLEASDENEIASTIILARCCADPPPVSYLTWNRGPDNSNPPAGATPSVDSTTASVAASTAAGGARDTAAENPSPTLDVISSAPAGGGGGILGVVGAGSTVAASATTPVAAVTGPAHGVSRMAVAAPSPFPGFSGGSTGGVDVAAEAAAAAAAVAAEAEAGVEAAAGLVAPVAGVEGGAGLLKRPSPRIDVEGDDSGSVRKMPRTEEPGDRGGDVGGTVDVGGGTAIVTNDHIRI